MFKIAKDITAMKKLAGLFFLLTGISLFGQTPTLIFHSGFEPNTDTTGQNSLNCDLIGADLSVSPPNDWINHLEADPAIGNFSIQYQGGDNSLRLAEITTVPTNPANHVLWFWIAYPNITSPSLKGRIQANIYNNPTGFTNLYYSIRLLIPEDLDTLKFIPVPITWFTLMEFWNNPNWIGNPYPFRITVNLQKPGYTADSLRFGVHGQIDTGGWTNVWDTTNTNFAVPTGKWMTIEINLIEGDSATGRFYMAVTPDGSGKTVVYDLHEYTHHPSDPAPDGFTHFNPFKLYTDGVLIDSLRNWGKLTHVYWDDFAIWKDSTITTSMNGRAFENSFKIYPNPFAKVTVLQAKTVFNNATLTVINSFGQTVKQVNNLSGQTFTLYRDNLPCGLYFIRITENKRLVTADKIVITD